MSIRDEELKRIESYLKGLGISVSRRKLKKFHSNAAEFYLDGKIALYDWPGQSKTQLVLNLIHEAGHAEHWVDTKAKPNKELTEALKEEDNRRKGEYIDVYLRKLIYEDEHTATHYWDRIIKLCNIKINPKVIDKRKKLDLFMYRHYYETGEFPTKQQIREFKANGKKR